MCFLNCATFFLFLSEIFKQSTKYFSSFSTSSDLLKFDRDWQIRRLLFERVYLKKMDCLTLIKGTH